MKQKLVKKCFSLLMTAAVLLSSVSLPAAPVKAEAAAEETDARDLNFNAGWKFVLGDISGAEQKDFDDSAWDDIRIPHDFSIIQEFSNKYEGESGFLPGGTGWYRKTAVFPKSYSGKSMILNFDGVYNNAYVYINGVKVGEHHYGYTNFSFDISKLLICDGTTENVIAVKAVHDFPSSRWYSGSGISRDVTLTVTGNVHVGLDGTYVTTPDLESQKNGDVTVKVETTVQNDSASQAQAQVRTTVMNAEGTAVSVPVTKSVTIAAGASAEVAQDAAVNKPVLWSWENPALYYVKTEVLTGSTVTDTYTTEFGFRYFAFDANTGFSLNGENVKLRGVCMHHDQGALGAASYEDAIYRQVRILKEMGCNAIRTSHNTPAEALIKACNEQGILLMDETFDGWSYSKNGNINDFGVYFNQKLTADNKLVNRKETETWAQFALEANVNRDKNAPSVIVWSIGNELPTGASGDFSTYPGIATNLISWIKTIDDTKPITMGDNQHTWSASDHRTNIDKQLIAAGGVIGLNYYPATFPTKHASQPTWPLVGTETASSTNSRGIYSTEGQFSKPGNYQCTAYDTYNVSWGNRARESWYSTVRYDYMAGEFVWTGFDYIGEPTPWNGIPPGSTSGDKLAVPNSSYFGIIDTAGFPKDSFYYYTSQWREDETTLHLVPGSWTEKDLMVRNGGYVPVSVYSNAAKVELYLNDEKIGTATRESTTTPAGYEYGMYTTASNSSEKCKAVVSSGSNAMSAQFEVKYAEGTLSLKAYDASGKEITGTMGISSATTNSDTGTTLKVTPEKTEIQADGSSLCYISVDVMDKNGNFVSGADNNIRFSLNGNATIVGVDNGNPSTVDKFQQKSVLTSDVTANINAFSGKALVIVRSTEKAGGFTLWAESTGLEGQRIQVATTGSEQGDVYLADYELQKEYAGDMGSVPVMQSTVNGTMSDGTKVTGTIAWDEITEEIYNNPGDYLIKGTLTIAGQAVPVSAALKIKPTIGAMLNYSRATSTGVVPSLPEQVAALLTNGRTYGEYPVKWDDVSADAFGEIGKIVTVNGTATVSDGVSMPVKATVRVAEGQTMEPVNVAPKYKTLTESCGNPSDNLLSIVNGVLINASNTNERWTNWNDRLLNPSASITFTWDETKKIDVLKLWFFADGSGADVPADVKLFASSDAVNYEEVSFENTEMVANAQTTFTLDKPQAVKGLRITMTQKPNWCVGLTECEIYTTAFGYESNSTAMLDSLTVDGNAVQGFVAGEYNQEGYQAEVKQASKAVVAAAARDNASVTILPADKNGVVRVLVFSEDRNASNLYELKLTSTVPMPDEKLLAEFAESILAAAGKPESDYTPESYAVLKNALAAARRIQSDKDATKAEVEAALLALKNAVNGLKKKEPQIPDKPSNPDKPVVPEVKLPKKGSIHSYKNAKYKITKSAAKGGTVSFYRPAKKTNAKITIPDTVKLKGIVFKVTEISDNALKANRKLARVIIGKNVKVIGKSAFEKDARLRNITINSTVLKTVKKGALKGIHPKAVIKVPKKKLNAYKKYLRNKGQKSTVKITR